MKSIENIIRIALTTFLAGALLVSCQEEEAPVAKAVLGTESTMTFSASNPVPKTITVYSDGPWHTTAPSWISVDPATGSGVTEVTVTAESNTDASGMLEPRKDTLIFSGNTIASRLIVIVSQEGDAYRNASHITLSEVTALTDGKAFVVDEATVAYLTAKGCVLTDGSVFVYVPTVSGIAQGDKVSVKGYKGSVNGVPAITQTDEVKNISAGSYTLPAAKDITSSLASFNGTAIEMVTISGTVAGGNISVEVDGVTYQIKPVDAPSALSLSSLNGNRVEVTGFSCGILGANQYGIIPTAIKDNGPSVVPRPEKLLYAKWRFTTSLLTNYASYFGGTSGVTDQTEGFSELYVPSNVEGNGRITYYQVDKTGYTPTTGNPKRIIGGTGHPYVTGAWPGDYWLFSATDNYEYPAGTQLHIKFLTRISATGQKFWMLEYYDGNDWKPAEEYPVATETETGNNVQYNFINPTANVEVECNWKLAVACREPKFRMRCVANWQSNGKGALENPNGGTCRIADNDDDGEDAGPVFEVTDAPATGGGDTGAKSFGATWTFDAEKTFEKDVDYSMNIKTGSWLKSDDGTALLTVNRLSENDGSKICTFTTDATWGETCYRFLSYSVYLNDYWMFEVPAPQHPAGKVRVNFSMSSSAAGPKVFVMDYSTDKENWTSFNVKSGSLTVSGEEPHDVSYTYLISPTYTAANERMEIDETFDLPASVADGTLYVRARVNDTSVNDLSKRLNGESHGGTNRIGKYASVAFTAN